MKFYFKCTEQSYRWYFFWYDTKWNEMKQKWLCFAKLHSSLYTVGCWTVVSSGRYNSFSVHQVPRMSRIHCAFRRRIHSLGGKMQSCAMAFFLFAFGIRISFVYKWQYVSQIWKQHNFENMKLKKLTFVENPRLHNRQMNGFSFVCER